MATIQRSITVNTPQDRVAAYLEDPNNMLHYAPGVHRVADVNMTDKRGGDSFRATYSALGLRFPIKFTVTEYVKSQKVVLKMEGGMKGTFTWTVMSRGNSTEVGVRIDYEMRGGIMGKAMNAMLLERMNEKNTERMLENIKMLAESEMRKAA